MPQTKNLQPVILAGGGGTRLWPMSRSHYPKQFLSLVNEDSLLQDTVTRLKGLILENEASLNDSIIICNEEHRFMVAEQFREKSLNTSSIILEPTGRNTAPALTVAALQSIDKGHDPILFMMPADHVINNIDAFHQAIRIGGELAEQGKLVTFGVTPETPETGYGYIRKGEPLETDNSFVLGSFVEKPDLKTAKGYLSSGEYLWNSGMFMMKASRWLDAIEKHSPDILKACKKAFGSGNQDSDFFRLENESFTACPSDSVDYAVMEKLESGEASVVELNAGWSDVGAWSSLWEISDKDDAGNHISGDVCAIESKNNLLMAEHRLLATVGCEDMVIIETADAVMVAPRDKSQDVKSIVDWLKQQNRDESLTHRRVFRPWGHYEGIDAGDRFQVKRITVKSGEKLSLQMHHHRAEHWIVVSGTAQVTKGDDVFMLTENQSTYIPLGVTHRLENQGTIPLEIIEVQSGSYLGEDDIVRFEDIYQRS